ncbi:hypothetical protein [uncultured Moraxella sp.]|uniref:hypothetical protein n=1 Tax=uncultured Moraxella sp. TaxID=263769 RepID=UPI0025CC2B97|nr:hypothetical protein [uncultured Moraxella sp.]
MLQAHCITLNLPIEQGVITVPQWCLDKYHLDDGVQVQIKIELLGQSEITNNISDTVARVGGLLAPHIKKPLTLDEMNAGIAQYFSAQSNGN